MQRYLRFALLAMGAVAAVLAFGFAFQISWVTGLWAWPDSRLTYIFLGSIAAAIAAPIVWIGISGELGAVTGGALNIMTAGIGISIYLFRLSASRDDNRIRTVAIVVGALALASLMMLIYCRPIPIRDQRPTPLLVRAAFGIFAIMLILVSIALLRQAAHVFPWPLRGDSSVVIGFIFFGAAFYFLYGVSGRFWGEATGQLLGFLAYDLVLIGPYLRLFSHVLPDHRLSLTIYTTVLIVSGALATYFLFVAPSTRFWNSGQASVDSA